MTLRGAGVSNTVVDGNGLDRVFHITGNASVQISDLTISDGDPGIGAGGDVLLYVGQLTLINSRVMNAAAHSGIHPKLVQRIGYTDSFDAGLVIDKKDDDINNLSI